MQKRIVLTKGFMKDHVNKNVCRSYCHPFLTRECAHRNERVIVIWANCHSLARSGDQLWTCKLESVVQVNRNFVQNGRKNAMEKRLTASPAHSLIVFWRSEVIRP